MPGQVPDFQDRAERRLITQYKESLKLVNFIRTLIQEASTLGEVLRALIEDRTIDKSTGVTLDIIGALVGQPRNVETATFDYAFAYRDLDGRYPLNTDGFSSLSDPDRGAPYAALDDTRVIARELTDEQYRVAIRARIARNYSRGTPEDVIFFTRFIAGSQQVAVEETGNASGVVRIGLDPDGDDSLAALAVQFIPKPVGVKLDIVSFTYVDGPFAFAGYPGGGSFGDANDPSIGGPFVEFF